LSQSKPSANEPRKLRILITLLYYYPHRTGLTIHVQRIAEELALRGHEVTVLTARHAPDLPRDITTHNGVRIVRLWAPIRISRGMLMPAFPLAAFLLMQRSDVVSIHTPMLETALVGGLAWLTGLHVIPTHHGDLVLPPGGFNRFIRETMFFMYRLMAKRAPRIIAYSDDYARNSYYLAPYAGKVVPNYPPIDIPEPRPERVQELRAAWRRDDGPIIGYSGRFVQEKRPELAIQALDVVNQTFPNAHLVFAGEYDIPYEDTWQREQATVKAHEHQLTFLGMLTDPQDLADFYAAIDVLVLPSDTECFALVQVEAMLCGTPVVMTDIPGGRVPVTVTGMGRLARAGDWRDIGSALVEVLTHRDDYIRPRSEIREIFSLERTVDTYETLLQTYARGASGSVAYAGLPEDSRDGA
jgi:glycosyltransferase involved in cell wall biosynthesis